MLYISRCRKMCEVCSFENFENSLTIVKVITKTKVAPFYLRHSVDEDDATVTANKNGLIIHTLVT